MNKLRLLLAGAGLALATGLTAVAQYETTATRTTYDDGVFGARAGDWEFTLGGSGSSNTDFDNSLGGVNLSLGYYFSDSLSLTLRQSGNYSNGPASDAEFDGSTFVALDYHFGTARLRPFLGVNAGRLYGENTNETWAAGIEGGLKFYVKPQTFVFALVNYAWTFEDSDDVTDNFEDGGYLWSVGVGFNF